MELTRIIHPIGQGGFYTETLKDDNEEVNIIYDCGGFYDDTHKINQSKTDMEHYLKNNNISKHINAIFISHFDWDHIIGLEYLLDPRNNYQVDYLFLPKLEEDEIIEALVSILSKVPINQKDFYDFVIKLIYGDYSLSQNLQIVFVSRYNNNTITNGIDISSLSAGIIPTGTKICFFGKWEYIPYNPSKNSKIVGGETFYECFKREIGNFRPKEFPSKIQGKVRKCKQIYKAFFGKHNSYSMTLYSGRKDTSSISSVNNCTLICNRCQIELTSPNCLFTGDFEKKYVTEMKNLYNTNKLWDSIQTIQIPHHGSKYNYSSDLYDCASCGFVSFGTTNEWNLPDKETLLNVNKQGCLPMMVTENIKTKIIFRYFE